MERRLLGSLLAAFALHAQVDVLTGNYDNNRTSSNLYEPYLWAGNVSPDTFGKLGIFPVSGQVYAQPLYVAGLDVPTCGFCNVLFVATMQNNVYAFNADDPSQTQPLWKTSLGTPVPTSTVLHFRAIDPVVGVLSTPVIDRQRNALYLI